MHDQQSNGTMTGFVIGAMVGAGLALLLAPASGRENRRWLKEASVDLRRSASGRLDSLRGKADEVKDGLTHKLDKVGSRLREDAKDVEAAVNEGFGAYQEATRQSGPSSKRT